MTFALGAVSGAIVAVAALLVLLSAWRQGGGHIDPALLVAALKRRGYRGTFFERRAP